MLWVRALSNAERPVLKETEMLANLMGDRSLDDMFVARGTSRDKDARANFVPL